MLFENGARQQQSPLVSATARIQDAESLCQQITQAVAEFNRQWAPHYQPRD